MDKRVPEVFDFTIDGKDYVVEFTRDAIKEADGLGVTAQDVGEFRRACIILYAGLKKNHPFVTLKRASQILDDAMEEGYSLDEFSDMIDEFTTWYKALFSGSGTAKKKPLLSRRSNTAQA